LTIDVELGAATKYTRQKTGRPVTIFPVGGRIWPSVTRCAVIEFSSGSLSEFKLAHAPASVLVRLPVGICAETVKATLTNTKTRKAESPAGNKKQCFPKTNNLVLMIPQSATILPIDAD
jgi:hypothetical protein